MEYRYQTAPILHGPYSPFWTLSIVSFSPWILEVRGWVDTITMHLSIPAWASVDSTVWRVYAANLRDPKSQFRLCVVNVGMMSRDRICLKAQSRRKVCLSSIYPYQILSQLLGIRFLFVFRIFFLWCHVMIKTLVGMFERRMSASDWSQRFSDDRRG
jgi:hypothetical protein